MKRRVVITGIGIITAHGVGKEINWKKTIEGISSIGEITSFDSSQYRGKHGGEAKELKEVTVNHVKKKRLDRASHLVIQTAREALTEAALIDKHPELLICLGTTLGGMLSGQDFHSQMIKQGIDQTELSLLSDYLAHKQAINLFHEYKLKGDYLIFSNACVSGASAIGYAFNAIREGSSDRALCGGYDVMSEFTFAGFNSLLAVSPTLCRPFDKHRDGMVLGEGAALLVLEELEQAQKRPVRIIGEITGYGESSDAYHLTSPEPSGHSAARAVTQALQDSGHPEIDYINAHGTGTQYNDTMETRAIIEALGLKGQVIPISSLKPLFGHTLGASAAVEAALSLSVINHNKIPPNINYHTPDPDCKVNVITQPVTCQVKTVLSNSFGFGGSNSSLILKEFL